MDGVKEEKKCSCPKGKKCPMGGECLQNNIVYHAEVQEFKYIEGEKNKISVNSNFIRLLKTSSSPNFDIVLVVL